MTRPAPEPSWSARLIGREQPDLENAAQRFLCGIYPTGSVAADRLWEALKEEYPAYDLSDSSVLELRLCLALLQNPATLPQWPEELRQSACFAGVLSRLITWTENLEWMDNAPFGCEAEVEQRLRVAQREWDSLNIRALEMAPLRAWFLRERGRLAGLVGEDPLPWIEKSMKEAARLEQWGEVAKNRIFLRMSSGETGPTLSARQQRELEPLLNSVPYLCEAPNRPELRSRLLSSLLELVPMEAAVWLEKGESWEVLDWSPRHIAPRYSRRLVEQCFQSRELSWGKPEQLRASHSLLLSEVRSLIACPVGTAGVLFAWQSDRQSWLTQDQVEAFHFLAKLAQQLDSNLALGERISQELASIQELHQRWKLIVENSSELTLAELDEAGCLVHWNEAFGSLFPRATVGQAARQLLPEAERMRDSQSLRTLTETGSQSRLVRIGESKRPRWIQLTDWKVRQQQGSFRAVLDVSRHDVVHWFDYLEEVRHLLASDLHDGPAQQAAAKYLHKPDDETRQSVDSIRYRLDFLRSPWLEGEDPSAWLLEFAETHFPDCRIIFPDPGVRRTRSQEQFLQRIRLGILDLLREQAEPLEEICFGENELTWLPALQLVLPPSLTALITSGLEVLGGRWSCRPGCFELRME